MLFSSTSKVKSIQYQKICCAVRPKSQSCMHCTTRDAGSLSLSKTSDMSTSVERISKKDAEYNDHRCRYCSRVSVICSGVHYANYPLGHATTQFRIPCIPYPLLLSPCSGFASFCVIIVEAFQGPYLQPAVCA